MNAGGEPDVVGYLEGFIEGTGRLIRLPIHTLPCRIGRRVDLEVQLSDPRVSQVHAEIREKPGGNLEIRDLDSTNGTFVNGRRIEGAASLGDGDLVRIAVLEFRFTHAKGRAYTPGMEVTTVMTADSPEFVVFGNRELVRLIHEQAVTPYYQPIVWLDGGARAGYEVLGRGNLEGLPKSPGELFRLASTYGMEANLSEIFRIVGVRQASQARLPGLLFVNMHPTEVRGGQLVRSIRELREDFPDVELTLEIHESAITDVSAMRRLRSELAALHVRLAYDDFGAGQARLNELGEVPPDVLKFDAALIRSIDQSGPSKQQLVSTLVRIARDLGVETLAEGVETRPEAEICLEIGFDLAQGYAFGEPGPIPSAPPERQ